LNVKARVAAQATESSENQIPMIRSSYRVFLAGSFYSGQNSESQEHNRPDRNPVGGYMQQVGGINQATDHDRESK
jgi:hypothetical protein